MLKENEMKFKVSVSYVEPLEKSIKNHNELHNTDFEIINIDYDEIIFCEIKATKFTQKDIFSLGYKLGILSEQFKVGNRK